jgi:hypothetical protein
VQLVLDALKREGQFRSTWEKERSTEPDSLGRQTPNLITKLDLKDE